MFPPNKSGKERMTTNIEKVRRPVAGHKRAQQIDYNVGLRIRERRTMLGLTQQQLAQRVGIAYQQTHKYETGANRISAGRLYYFARALEVEVSYFFENLDAPSLSEAPELHRAMLELARSFANQPSRQHQEALCQLAKALGEPEDVIGIEAAPLAAA
jgi:DNA-binding XRE family transcriptional regulator